MLAQSNRKAKAGAGGGTRTRTAFYGPGILSPVRLPFRHTGKARIKYLLMSSKESDKSRVDKVPDEVSDEGTKG